MKFDERGIPILTLDEKLAALCLCMKTNSHEDALGHLFDLIHAIAPDGKYLGNDVHETYGMHPTPVIMTPRLGPVDDAIEELREAGLKAWDDVDDPESLMGDLRS